MATVTFRRTRCSSCGKYRKLDPGPCKACGARVRIVEQGFAAELHVAGRLQWSWERVHRVVRKRWLVAGIVVTVFSTIAGLLVGPIMGVMIAAVTFVLSLFIPPQVVLIRDRHHGDT